MNVQESIDIKTGAGSSLSISNIEAAMGQGGQLNLEAMVSRRRPLEEVNEAFACVAMFAIRDIGIDHAKINVNGGATALGHPIGASGTRIIVTLINALKTQGKTRGVASLCIGGGEATAVAVELV